ncbi:putative [Escherichia phage Mu]|uniref:Bacteriophage Mu left end n=1 Tax=Escherichia phage Mu TaxID=2681603 RepID=Q38483_BPMU|nr:putative [Escherichia phage Mu]
MPDLTVIPATPATAFGSSKIASLLISCFVRIKRCRPRRSSVSITASIPRILTDGGRTRHDTSPVTRFAVFTLPPFVSSSRFASHHP